MVTPSGGWKQQNIRKFKTCDSSGSSSSSGSASSISNWGSNIKSSICNCSSKINVVVAVEIYSSLNLSYEVRFVGLGQNISNAFGSV